MMRIDAHHHLWDLGVRPQSWITSEYAPINRSFLIAEFAALAAASSVTASVVVQTVSDRSETVELLALAEHSLIVAGVVGWVDLTAGDLDEQLAWLLEQPGGERLCGIRHQVHDEPDIDWICRPDVQRGIAAVGRAVLTYDLLLKPQHLSSALRTVDALDDVRFVIDHAAKPPVATGELEPWRSGIRALAARPNTFCKLSGLLTEANWTSWTIDDLRPYAEVVVEAFGVDRVMTGSDWPVSTLVADYDSALSVYDVVLPGLSETESWALHADSAISAYLLLALECETLDEGLPT